MKIKAILLTCVLAMNTTNAFGGIYTDELSKCLIESTSNEDKISLVKWMFAAASNHPAVKSISSITSAQVDSINKQMAELLVKLLTESCKEQAVKAVKYEGQLGIQSGFQVLGQVAAGELYASPEVAQSLSGLQKHIDAKKLEAVFGSPK